MEEKTVRSYVEHYCSIQEILLNISDNNIIDSFESLNEKESFGESNFSTFSQIFINTASVKIWSQKSYINLIKLVFAKYPLLSSTFVSFALRYKGYGEINVFSIFFLRALMNEGILSFDEIFSHMKFPNGIIVCDTIAFFPELYYKGTLPKKDVPPYLFYFGIPEYTEPVINGEMMATIVECLNTGSVKGTLKYSLKYDDIDLLRDIIESPEYQKSDDTSVDYLDYYMGVFGYRVYIKTVEYASFYGSLKCIKYLALSDDSFLQSAITKGYSACSDCLPLFHMYDKAPNEFSLIVSSAFMKNELLNWTLDEINDNSLIVNDITIDTLLLSLENCSPLYAAFLCNSVVGFLYMFDRINGNGTLSERLFNTLTGDIDHFNWPLVLMASDLLDKTVDLEYLLIKCIERNIYEPVYYLIQKQPELINVKYRGRTILEKSIEFKKDYLFEYLFPKSSKEDPYRLSKQAIQWDKPNILKKVINHPQYSQVFNSIVLGDLTMVSIEFRNQNCLKVFFERDVSFTYSGKYNTTPLNYAVQVGEVEIVKLLINHKGVDANLADGYILYTIMVVPL